MSFNVFYGWIILIIMLLHSGCENLSSSQIAQSLQEECGFVQNSKGERVSWKKRYPVLVYFSPSWPVEYKGVVQKAASKWNLALGFEVLKLGEGADLLAIPKVDKKNGLYWFKDWPEKSKNKQGITQVFYSKNIIRDADIKVNSKHFHFYIDSYEDQKKVHLESLMIHEFGHLLGLKHMNRLPTVMDPILNLNYERTKISKIDLESIKCEYKL